MIAEAIKTDAEIGVLGDVIGIPAADLTQHGSPKVVRRTAKRKRQTQRRKSGQKYVELAGIIGREHASQPVISGVVDGQAGLNASKPAAGAAERIEGAAQLVGVRRILGVIDDGIRAAREGQRHIERFRLGPWTDRRRDNNLERRPEVETNEGALGVPIVGLQNEFHVEFFGRIVRYYGANATRIMLACRHNGRS